ncbi:Dyp-type peroxidase [Demequina capsici]|uniref:Dyp-type peroxidase n=1 Tax=Demequina capsici TaxID=3075620 RepID=A0AA96FDJ0_9MICO|nr:Dyp-type peroxidase [Demequina sp. PMTSA13]WNM27475.1 Dyp-type peroxidase [Demequina sp. PMTSA13]
MSPADATTSHGPSRRGFLTGSAAAVGVATGAAGGYAAARAVQVDEPRDTTGANGGRAAAFAGAHQAGITSSPGAHGTFLAFDLVDGSTRDDLRRLMRLWSDDARRLMAGQGALADTEPELAAAPAGLTVTFGWGRAATVLAGGEDAAPAWLKPLPAFSIDALENRWSDGDLLVMIHADDPVTVSHAARMITKDAASLAVQRWHQTGFRQAYGTHASGTTMRNLFGQVDGTTNPPVAAEEFARRVWIADGWLTGGTSFVLRRIRMDLAVWDQVDRIGRENAVGRTLDTGAPLTGTVEHDEPDLDAVDARGFPIISDVAHLRRARPGEPAQRIVRMGFNYDEPARGGAEAEAGLLFGSVQADVDAQFVPIQERLAQADLLNVWTTPVGSAVFAILPGCSQDGYLGDGLLEG